MTLFDAYPPAPASDQPARSFRVDVWAPAGGVWIPLDRLQRGVDEGRWTFPTLGKAVQAAFEWIDRGEILAPVCRAVDEDGQVAWTSTLDGPTLLIEPNPAYL